MITTGSGGSVGGWLGLVPMPLLAFGLIPGPRELIVVILVALVLYGRSGVRVLQDERAGRPVSPWVRVLRRAFSPVPAHRRRKAAAAADPPSHTSGRFFWALALIAAVAVAAWITTRAVIHGTALPR
jgi:hypothetical protein